MGLIKVIRNGLSAKGITVLKVMVVCGGLAIANFVAFDLQYAWDTSEGRVHSLAASTLEIIDTVETDVRILVFAEKLNEAIHELMERFNRASELVTTEFVQINENEALARKYGVTRNGETVVEMGERYRVTRLGEEKLAGAILQLVKGNSGRVLFTSGHGERSLPGQEHTGMAQAQTLLGQAGYATAQQALTEEDLADVCVIVVAGPREEFTAQEVEVVKGFVAGGGGLLVLVDPPPASGVDSLLAEFGVKCENDYVVELNKAFRQKGYGVNTILVRSYLSGHPVADRMGQGIMLSYIRSIGLTAAAKATVGKEGGSDWQRLCLSSPNSWGETAMGVREVTWDKGADSPGPRNLVVASPDPPSAAAGAGRAMVVGTSAFATNRFLSTSGNREFFEAAVSWLAGDLNYPLVSQKEPTRQLSLSSAQLRWMFVVCVLVLPGLSAIVGVVIFVRRARRSN